MKQQKLIPAAIVAVILGIGNAAFAEVAANIPAPKTTTPERIDIVAGKSDEEREEYGRRHFGRKPDGSAPIHRAAARGDVRIVRHYLVSKENPNVQMNNGRTPLHLAAKHGHADVARELINRGANMELREEYGKTPLYFAAAFGKTGVMRELLNNGAAVDAKDRDDKTPLRIAVEYGQSGAAELLVEHEADNAFVNQVAANDKNRYTPLHWAADGDGGRNVSEDIAWAAHAKGKPQKVALALIKAGAHINAKGSGNLTPLHVAILHKRTEVVRVLVANGASLHAVASSHGGGNPMAMQLRVRGPIEIEYILRDALAEYERKKLEREEARRFAELERTHRDRVRRYRWNEKEAKLDYCNNVQQYATILCAFWSLGW